MDEQLADLAGATLDDVTVDWRNGIVLISFLPSPKERSPSVVRATDFSRVEVPRAGASRRVKSVAQDGDTIAVLMESGETLRVTAARFALDHHGG